MADGSPNPISPRRTTTATEVTATLVISAPGRSETTSVPEKIRTLVVDDQAISREVLRHMLKREKDVEVIGMSANGREAVAAIHEMKPDLVFLDVQMPELDGFGVVSEVGSRMPAFIFVTANRDYSSRASEVRAVDCLFKPCERQRLRAALERARQRLGCNPAS